jgi:hypothetical protein
VKRPAVINHLSASFGFLRFGERDWVKKKRQAAIAEKKSWLWWLRYFPPKRRSFQTYSPRESAETGHDTVAWDCPT